MALPNFIETDPNIILEECFSSFSRILGRPVNPNQLEGLLTHFVAEVETRVRIKANNIGQQMLIDGASGAVLDAMVALLNVIRQPASFATADFLFELNAGHGGVTIPAATMISSQDGLAVFQTIENHFVPYNENTVILTLEAMTAGSQMNNYNAGYINVIQSPQPYLVSVSNITASVGGAAAESDEALRARYKRRFSTFSTAGAEDAYEYFALSAHPSIRAVGVVSTPLTPGQVYIYPLLYSGEVTPPAILQLVDEAVNSRQRRPLTSTVYVLPPTRVNIDLIVSVIIYNDSAPAMIEEAIETSVRNYFSELMDKLGRDVVLSQVIRAAQVDGVYSVDLNGFNTVVINDTSFPYLNSLTVQILGTTNG